MALVAYSDSEGSDTEATSAPAPKATTSKAPTKAGSQKVEARKIKVDLPNIKPESQEPQDEQPPPAKRARTGGAFSGFNSLLPAPKKAAPKAGVSLKTSSEAAFSRAPIQQQDVEEERGDVAYTAQDDTAKVPEIKEEPKVVGKATKFKPLSVANKKKTVKKARPSEESRGGENGMVQHPAVEIREVIEEPAPPPPPKPKRSLFSVPQPEDEARSRSQTTNNYESLTQPTSTDPPDQPTPPQTQTQPQPPPNTLHSLASDLNLTPAQRRQLFGRTAKNADADINITHFDMDNEYAANEQLRQAGEVVEHKAVKAIAPGKHSLQQLVNNARSQQDNLEDKWAEGRRERGDAGGRYGWGR
ncbi:hypothetical protein LTR37_017874 [Vermiconidia calcicola]|uniref:Uncharacterized protein n=1 Tax=Vermiconidia calcicola TaxID=1690605 RepID=A0ACC3MJN1_9PEZI|nr:hypothetical protein LTR37_017874 [Vermiconidia calcicola]